MDLNEFIKDQLSKGKLKTILVDQNDKILPIPIDEIALLYMLNGIVKILTFDNRTYYYSESLEHFELLGMNRFYRANRQFIINKLAIKDVTYALNRKLQVNLNIVFNQQILISKEKATEFLDWLTNY